jgi:hypothetical protein
MRSANAAWMSFCAAAAAVAIVLSGAWPPNRAAAEPAVSPPGDIVSGAWQHHKVRFDYVGFTALYTCDGLEGHVRLILQHLGARDVKVYATGCPGPINTPSRNAWVDVEFYSLAAVSDPAGLVTVEAHWTPLEVAPRRPSFMGDGDCELMQGMKDVITKNFTLRGVKYNATCFPNQISPGGFEVKGEALRAVPASKGSA